MLRASNGNKREKKEQKKFSKKLKKIFFFSFYIIRVHRVPYIKKRKWEGERRKEGGVEGRK